MKDFFKAEERESLVNKYVPVALNSLYRLYSYMGEGNEELDEEKAGQLIMAARNIVWFSEEE